VELSRRPLPHAERDGVRGVHAVLLADNSPVALAAPSHRHRPHRESANAAQSFASARRSLATLSRSFASGESNGWVTNRCPTLEVAVVQLLIYATSSLTLRAMNVILVPALLIAGVTVGFYVPCRLFGDRPGFLIGVAGCFVFPIPVVVVVQLLHIQRPFGEALSDA
jgi:hypothetical protein